MHLSFAEARHQPLGDAEDQPGDQVNQRDDRGEQHHAEKIAANLISEQQYGRDRSGTGQERYREWKDRDVFARRALFVPLGRLKAGPLPEEHRQRSHEQENPAANGEGVHRHPEIRQEEAAGHQEEHRHRKRDGERARQCLPLLGSSELARQSDEHRRDADGIHDDDQRRERPQRKLQQALVHARKKLA
jgi:hypothetical protein